MEVVVPADGLGLELKNVGVSGGKEEGETEGAAVQGEEVRGVPNVVELGVEGVGDGVCKASRRRDGGGEGRRAGLGEGARGRGRGVSSARLFLSFPLQPALREKGRAFSRTDSPILPNLTSLPPSPSLSSPTPHRSGSSSESWNEHFLLPPPPDAFSSQSSFRPLRMRSTS